MCLRKGHSVFVYVVIIVLTAVIMLVVFNIRLSNSQRWRLGLLKKHHYKPRYSRDTVTVAPRGSNMTSGKSYMLSLHYAEQLTMSTAHYIQFLNLVAGWNFTGVEPYIYKSRMFGLLQTSKVNVKFGLLLNMSTLNSELCTCLKGHQSVKEKPALKLFDSMNEFLNHSYRSIAIVYFIKHMHIFPKEIHDGMDYGVKFGKEPVVDCTSIARTKGLSEAVEITLNQNLYTSMSEDLHTSQSFNKLEFYVQQAFCVHKQ